jgi:hypothetical protein
MTRFCCGFLLLLGTSTARLLSSQASSGGELWRLAAATMPVPAALAGGAVASYWNPAQGALPRGQLGLDLIQTPAAVGAIGFIGAIRIPIRRVGSFGFVYARMGLGDLVRTTDSPDPDGTTIPFYTQSSGVTWARGFGGGATALGIALTYHETRLDGIRADRWTIDVGVTHWFLADRLRLAAGTRGLRRLGNDPGQDVNVGVEYRLWRGTLWGTTGGTLVGRYGFGFGHPGGADHQLGAGLDVGPSVSLDAIVAREESYGNAAWRSAAGVRIAVGRYRLTLARDGGVSDLGSTFRIGLEARLR